MPTEYIGFLSAYRADSVIMVSISVCAPSPHQIRQGGSCEDYDDIEEVKKYSDWIEANKILWAVTNSLGVPTEMPEDKIDQVWNTWGIIEKKHFRLTEYTGDME